MNDLSRIQQQNIEAVLVTYKRALAEGNQKLITELWDANPDLIVQFNRLDKDHTIAKATKWENLQPRD